MSSVYGPALLKAPEVEDNVDEAIGKKNTYEKTNGEFETAHDRAKRIRKERRAQAEKDKEASKMQQMSQAINTLLAGKDKKVAPNPVPNKSTAAAAGSFKSFGPAAGSAGPAGPPAGPSVGPSAGPAGPSVPAGPPSVGPAGPPGPPVEPVVAPGAASAGPAPRPRGPMRPSVEERPDVPAAPESDTASAPPAQQNVKLGYLDILKDQKRVSWDQLKENLSKVSVAEKGVPGSREFDDYSAKLEKERNERLGKQEDDTKRLLKHMNKGKSDKKEKKKKEKKKEKGVKRTADGAVLAQSSDDESSQEDTLLARYKKAA